MAVIQLQMCFNDCVEVPLRKPLYPQEMLCLSSSKQTIGEFTKDFRHNGILEKVWLKKIIFLHYNCVFQISLCIFILMHLDPL